MSIRTRAAVWLASLAAAAVITRVSDAHAQGPRPMETRVPAGNASLYARDVGRGPAMIVLHGGPDFDHRYLLPDLDRLADAYHLVYYDQRGRGQSADGVRAEDVSLASDVDDVERVRRYFHLDSVIVVGHSWGTVLALEYALRYPSHISRLVLMNPAPASASDYGVLRAAYIRQLGPAFDRERAMIASDAYKNGNPDTVTARYRIHFSHAVAHDADYEKLMAAMQGAFIAQGSEGILKSRAVENRLMADSWSSPGYDLLPRVRGLTIPTLVIAGDRDFIPAEIAAHIAGALPAVRLVTLRDCGHFSYLECPADLRRTIDDFVGQRPR